MFAAVSLTITSCCHQARKSVGAEVNWGVRFRSNADADKFLQELAAETSSRLTTAGVKGRCFTLKIKRRQANAPEPPKFLGHGACDNFSRSVTLSRFVDNPDDIYHEVVVLLDAMKIPHEEIRGMGITVGCRWEVCTFHQPTNKPTNKQTNTCFVCCIWPWRCTSTCGVLHP